MALVQVSPQAQDYGQYANPTWVRANTAGNVALGQAIAGVAKQAGQHFIDKAIENKAVNEQNKKDQEELLRQQRELEKQQADAKAKYEADLEKKRQEILNANANNETLSGIANMAGEFGRKMSNPEADKAELDFQALDQMPAGSYTPVMSIQGRIDDLEAKRQELDQWSTAKKRRDIRKDFLKSDKGTRSERIAEYKAKYDLLNTQVDDLIELNNFNIDPEVLKNVDESKIRKGDRQKYFLAKALGSGDYQSRIGEDGMVFIDYTWEDINGKKVKSTELVSALADNIKERTQFGFNFEMSTDEGFNKLANTWATRVGKDISRFYTKVEYPLGPGQPGVTTLDREALKKQLSLQNDLVGNLIDGFSQRAIDEIDGINSREEFLDKALDYVIDTYIPFEGSKYPVAPQQSYSGRGGRGYSNNDDPVLSKVDDRVEGILRGIKLDQDTLRGTKDTPAHSTLNPKGEGAFSILAAKYGGRVSVERSPLPPKDIEIKPEDYGTGNFNDLYGREINKQNKRNYKETISVKDENGKVIKSYNLNDATGVTRLAFDLSEEIEFTKDLEKIFSSQEQFRNYLRFKIKERIDDYNAGIEFEDESYFDK